MKIIRTIEDVVNIELGTVIALGTFDGVHTAHEEVIKSAVNLAKKNKLLSVVYTFSNHPRELSGQAPKRLITPSQKIKIIEKLGVDILVMVPFDQKQLNLSADDFLKGILTEKLCAKHIVVGYNFRFGKGAQGDVHYLRANALELKYNLDIVEPIKYNHVVVSSTLIRNYLLDGDVESANRLLGRKYCIDGFVKHGKKMGRKLGFPTINLETEYEMSVLKPGVYLTETIIDQKLYHSLTNVGFNPTFDQKEFNIETFIIDFSDDVYGEHVRIQFINYIREELKFEILEDLITQIDHDVQIAKEYFKI